MDLKPVPEEHHQLFFPMQEQWIHSSIPLNAFMVHVGQFLLLRKMALPFGFPDQNFGFIPEPYPPLFNTLAILGESKG